MGLIKKVFKGIKKVAKKIGKGIKKVVNKIGRAFGKLGIVGQLGMMFLMPYAMSGLSSFFGQFALKGGTTWASQLAGSSNIFAQGIGKAMGAIHSAGSAIGSAYNSVTQAISNGFDRAGNFLKGEGFTLTPKPSGVPTEVSDFAADTASKVKELNADTVKDVVDNRSLLEKGKDFVGESFENFKKDITDPEKMGQRVSGGLVKGATTRLAYSVAGEPPIQQYVNISPFDIGTIETFNKRGVFNEVDFNNMNNAYQSVGSAWGAMNSLGQPHLMDTLSGGDATYIQTMNQLRGYGN